MRINFQTYNPIQTGAVIHMEAGSPFLITNRVDDLHDPDDVFFKISYRHDDDKQLLFSPSQGRFLMVAADTQVILGYFTAENIIVAKSIKPEDYM